MWSQNRDGLETKSYQVPGETNHNLNTSYGNYSSNNAAGIVFWESPQPRPVTDVMPLLSSDVHDTLNDHQEFYPQMTSWVGQMETKQSPDNTSGIVFWEYPKPRPVIDFMPYEQLIPLLLAAVHRRPHTNFLSEEQPIAVRLYDVTRSSGNQFQQSFPGTSLGDCSICLQAMKTEDVANMSCGHFFHVDCINQWNRRSCPLCRHEYFQIGHTAEMDDSRRQNCPELQLMKTLQSLEQAQFQDRMSLCVNTPQREADVRMMMMLPTETASNETNPMESIFWRMMCRS